MPLKGKFLGSLAGILDPSGIVSTIYGTKTLKSGYNALKDSGAIDKGKSFLSGLWKDYTGQTAIDMQNTYNKEMAELQYQNNLRSIGDTAAATRQAYQNNGLNPNLMYGGSGSTFGSGVSAPAPEKTAYTGSQRLDKVLKTIGTVLNFVPAIYQASAMQHQVEQAKLKTDEMAIQNLLLHNELYRRQTDTDMSGNLDGYNWRHRFGYVTASTGDLTPYQESVRAKKLFDIENYKVKRNDRELSDIGLIERRVLHELNKEGIDGNPSIFTMNYLDRLAEHNISQYELNAARMQNDWNEQNYSLNKSLGMWRPVLQLFGNILSSSLNFGSSMYKTRHSANFVP